MVTSEERKEQEEGINLEHLSLLFLSHWYWFVGAVLIALGLASFYILKTTPIYTRTSQLLIKDDEGGKSASVMQDFKDLGLISSNTNIKNEILTLSAPVMMEHVVKRLNLDLDLKTKVGLKTISLYNNAPVKVEFANKVSDDSFVNFKLSILGKNQAEIHDLVYMREEFTEVYKVTIDGDFVKTPVGAIKITRTPSWNDDCIGHDISVTKYPVKNIASAYSGSLSISLSDKEATVLNLTINDEVIDRADDILLTLIDVYNENWVKDKNRMAESTCQFINERLENITKELGDVDEDISNFKSANLLPDMQASLTKDYAQSSKNYESLLQLNNQLSMTMFIHDYLSDKSKHDQLLPSNMGLPSSGVESMISAYNQMMLERGTILTNSTEDSPVVKDMDRKLGAQKTAILRSLDNLVIQLKKQIANIERSERTINNQIATAPRQVKELQSVERQQKVKEALYIFLLQKREENELSRTYTAWNTNIIQPPTGSAFPTSPRKSMIALIALVLGIAVPGGLLFLFDTMNTKVRGRKDLEGMKTPLIGEIPDMATKKHWWNKRKKVARKVVVEADNKNIINESFRLVRTKLDYFMGNEGDNKVVMLTSFNPGSGKSFIAANLGKTFALNGKRILIIDMDLRHKSLSAMLSSKHKVGLSSYLNGGEADLDQIIVKKAFGDNIDVIPVGVTPPNPTETLYSKHLSTLMEKMRQEYDLIFLDCPPIEIVADAAIIKRHADVSLFVVRAGLMDRRVLNLVDELYAEKKYNHLAILLNGTDFISGKYGHYRYGYGYGYGYSYGYGYGYGDGYDSSK